MRTNGRMRSGLAAIAVVLLPLVPAGVTPPPAGAFMENAKYYEVAASYAGQPENLSEIASRFLGSPSRQTDIFDLNAGRIQPDGRILTDANALQPGWYLILPWDAVGGGVQLGKLPGPNVSPTSPPTSPPGPVGDAWGSAPSGGSTDTVTVIVVVGMIVGALMAYGLGRRLLVRPGAAAALAPVRTPAVAPPADGRPPARPTSPTAPVGPGAGKLPRRIPAARPTMALDHTDGSRPESDNDLR